MSKVPQSNKAHLEKILEKTFIDNHTEGVLKIQAD